METCTVSRPRAALFVSALSAVPSLMGNRSGIGLSWDSTDYIAVGLSMSAGRGALDVTGVPTVIRPPGLSAFVTLGDWLMISPDISLRLVNAVSMMLIVWCTHYLFSRAEVRPTAKWIGITLVALSPMLLDLTTMAWSEPPFLALTLLALVIATRQRTWPWDLALCIVFTSMFFIRYVGPFYAAPIALVAAVVQSRTSGVALALLRSGASLAVSMVLPWLWLMRNKNLTGYLTGYREAGGGNLLDPLKTFTGTLGSWLLARPPLDGNVGIYLNWNDFSGYMKVAGVVVWVLLAVLVASYFLRPQCRRRDAATIMAISLLLFVSYGGFSMYRFVYHEMGPLDSRMMSGLYVPLILMLVIALDASISRIPTPTSRRFLSIGILAALPMFVIPAWHAVETVRNTVSYGSTGRHWGTEFHRTVPIHKFAASLPHDAAVYSNEPQSLFAATFHWPIRNQYMYQIPYDLPCSRRYFVWFNQSYLPDGKPVGGEVLYEDSWGQVIDLDACDTDIGRFWP